MEMTCRVFVACAFMSMDNHAPGGAKKQKFGLPVNECIKRW